MSKYEKVKEIIARELTAFLLPARVMPSDVVISVYYDESVATIRLSGDRLANVKREIRED